MEEKHRSMTLLNRHTKAKHCIEGGRMEKKRGRAIYQNTIVIQMIG